MNISIAYARGLPTLNRVMRKMLMVMASLMASRSLGESSSMERFLQEETSPHHILNATHSPALKCGKQ